MAVYLKLERGRDSFIGPTLGPFEWVQITYEIVRIPVPDGENDTLLWRSECGDWYLHYPRDVNWDGTFYSDIIISDIKINNERRLSSRASH